MAKMVNKKLDSYRYYLQHHYNSDKINTRFGVRLEDNGRFGNHTVDQGAIRYHFTPATSVYANIGSAFGGYLTTAGLTLTYWYKPT